MTEEQIELARALVACEQWDFEKLRGGSVVPLYGNSGATDRIAGFDDAYMQCWTENPGRGCWIRYRRDRYLTPEDGHNGNRVIPDLSDYATAAILLRMALEFDPGRTAGSVYSPDLQDPYWDIDLLENFRDKDLGTAAARALLAVWGDSK
jgi:hypothetical protein